MIRRYDLRRSDNFPFTGKKAYAASGEGFITIKTGFPITSAIITWASIPIFDPSTEFSSSSESSESLGGLSSTSSSSSVSDSSLTSQSDSTESSSTSSLDSSSSSSSTDVSDSSSSSMSPDLSESSWEYSTSSSSIDSSSTSSEDTPSSISSSSSSSIDSSSTSSQSDSSPSSTTSNEYYGPFNFPRIYVYELLEDGFVVRFENVPEEMVFVEFSYYAL